MCDLLTVYLPISQHSAATASIKVLNDVVEDLNYCAERYRTHSVYNLHS